MYKPHSLEQERASWINVIYFNVIHSLKHILATLEAWDDSLEGLETRSEDGSTRRLDSFPDPATPSPSSTSPIHGEDTFGANGSVKIANLRRRLSPLIATDEQLADRLSGGITVSGSGKGSVFVRSGWQSRTLESALGRMRRRQSPEDSKDGEDALQDPLVNEISRMLQACESDIQELWSHPTVKGLIAKRKLKLDEWSE